VARFLTTIPSNLGYYNLGTVESYPTGGTGPTAYGPTSYFGSDPLPETLGDSVNNPVPLGDFSSVFRSITISNSHGGLSRRQSTFYSIKLTKPRSIQFTQNFSQFAYTQNTNRNTLLAFYKIENGTKRVELPINDNGYVFDSTGVDYDEYEQVSNDYPNTKLDPGNYIFLITNDIRYLETTYSITIGVSITDWRFVDEAIEDFLDFDLVTEGADEVIDFGSLAA
jgi:hypothetical protein